MASVPISIDHNNGLEVPVEVERRDYPIHHRSDVDTMVNMMIDLREDDMVVNTKHDITSYESCDYQREILTDANKLYEGFRKAARGSDWKSQVQQFEINYLTEISRIQDELYQMIYRLSPTTDFILRERGKIRYVSGEHIRDRVVKHVLCDELLSPEIRPYLIYDNGASLTGKGMSFTRKRILTHLHRYYFHEGTNEGWVLLLDFTKYYDNIRHDELRKLFDHYTDLDETSKFVLNLIIDSARIDVSYMDDETYRNCIQEIFNSLDYYTIPKRLKTGEKFMEKHMNIGDQLAQIAGISYPTKLDNFIKIRCGMKYYSRYMDDSYIIHRDKKTLQILLDKIREIAASIGIFISDKKTQIVPLGSNWKFLQMTYSLTETGRVIVKINKKRLTAMRRKLKKLAPILSPDEFEQLYKSWFKAHYRYMSKLQRENLDKLYVELKGV